VILCFSEMVELGPVVRLQEARDICDCFCGDFYPRVDCFEVGTGNAVLAELFNEQIADFFSGHCWIAWLADGLQVRL
jgi:hypothetical protein